MRISDWSSDVCSSDPRFGELRAMGRVTLRPRAVNWKIVGDNYADALHVAVAHPGLRRLMGAGYRVEAAAHRSEEHTSELQSLMRISYAVFCLKKKKKQTPTQSEQHKTTLKQCTSNKTLLLKQNTNTRH